LPYKCIKDTLLSFIKLELTDAILRQSGEDAFSRTLLKNERYLYPYCHAHDYFNQKSDAVLIKES